MTAARLLLLAVCLWMASLAQAGPVVRWLEQDHDFGTINEEGGTVTCVMRLVNDGDSALLITHARTSCGCTVTEHPREAIMPGDTAAIRVTYNPHNRPGQFVKDVFVYTNAASRRSMVSIRGNVVSRPETLLERYPVAAGHLRMDAASVPLGELSRDRRRSSYITTYNSSAADTLLVSVAGAPAHIKAAAAPDTLAPGTVGAVTVFYDARQAPQWGLNIDTLIVTSRPLRPGPTATSGVALISVMAQVQDDFSTLTDKQRRDAPVIEVSADKLMFSPERPTATMTVANRGRSALELRRLWTAERGVAIRCDRARLKPGKQATVTVTVSPEQLAQPLLNGRMTIVSNAPAQPAAVVRLVGQF